MAKNTKKKTTAQSSKATEKVEQGATKSATETEVKPVEQVKKPVPKETKNFNPPEKKKIEELKFYFGNRQINPLDNSAILRSRFLYQFEPSKYENCHDVTDKDSGKTLGVITRMQLQHTWRMANSIDAKKKCGENAFFITQNEWESELEIITKYVLSNRKDNQSKVPVMFNEVWKMTEIEFEMLGLRKPKQVSVLLQTAIIGQMEENRRLLAIWKKIKKYPHKVALEESDGGVFSESDAKKLRTLKIKYLNDIRNHNVLEIKNLVLEKSFENIVKDINVAFKNDLERRRDYRYKFYPFLTAFANFAVIITACFYYKYTLIKNSPMTVVIMTLLALCVLDFFVILIGGKRAKKRVKIVPNYKFYTKGVKWSLATYFLVCLFSVGSVFFFYQRYDGYNDTLYYRDVDGGIAIAGLRDEDKKSIIIPTEIDGKTVVEIEKYAFKGDSITNLIVSDTVTYIDEESFASCSNLKAVTLSESVEEVGKKAFSNCKNLERIVFDTNSDVVLYDNVFESCESLTHIYGFESVSKIGGEAFYNCSNLQYFDFSDNLTQIGNGAYKNCNGIKNLVLPASLLSVGSGAFYNCNGIEQIIFPCNGSTQSITEYISFSSSEEKEVYVKFVGSGAIPANALKNANWVSEVEIGEEVSSIGAGAFEGVSKLFSVDIPTNITTLPANVFAGCSSLVYVQGLEYVSQLGENSFADCTSLTTVNLNPTLTQIPDGAFKNTALTQINLPDTVTNIGASAFANCGALTDIDLSYVTTIGSSAFESSNLITSVTLCNALTNIGERAFKGLGITSIVLPESVTNIGQDAFKDCENLASITTPLAGKSTNGDTVFNDIVSFSESDTILTVNYVGTNPIQTNAFSAVPFVSSIVINGAVTEIGEGAFAQMSALESITLPTTVTTLPARAFKESTNLSTINGINNVTVIGYESFMGCNSLQSLDVSSAMMLGSSVFENCANLTSVTLSTLIDTIPDRAFYNTAISSITIPESVKTIGESAFCESSLGGNISLENVETINKSAFKGLDYINSLSNLSALKYLGDSAFEGCDGIMSVIISSENLEYLGPNAFKDCYRVREIAVPYVGKTIDDTDSSLDDFFYVHSYGVNVVVTQAQVAYPKYFEGLTGITSVYFQSLREVKPNAFKGLSIQNFSFTSSLQTIGESAFEDCTLLESVEGLQYLDSVPSKTFKNCSNLRTISHLSSAVSIGSYAFSGCRNLYTLNAPNVRNIGNFAFEDCYNFSSINNFTKVETIGEQAFLNCTSISNVNLYYLTSVDKYAFRGSSITSVYIPPSMQTVSDYAFASCSLNQLTADEGVTTIGKYAFADTPLYTVQLPSTINSIGNYAFSECDFSTIDFTSISSVTLGEGVFMSCRYLSEANLPTSLTNIPAYTFSNCTSLERTNAYDLNIITIGDEAFYGCLLSYEPVAFNYALKTIGSKAFASTSILSVELHNSLTQIGNGAFEDCPSLSSVTIPFLGQTANDRTNGYAYLFAGSAVENLTLTNQSVVQKTHFANIGSSLKTVSLTNTSTIGESAFEDCYYITTVNLSNTLTTIGKNAFKYCSALSQIEIPTSVKEIPEGAFMYCNSLTSVNLETMEVTKISKNAFAYTSISSFELRFNEGLVTVEESAFEGYSTVVAVFSSTMTNVSRKMFGDNPFEISVAVPTDEMLTQYTGLFEGLNVYVTKI